MKNFQNRGWIRLYRKIEENPLWLLEPFTRGQAWVDLFLNANFKENLINIRGNLIKVKRGQIAWSELTMAKRWRWSRNKVRRFLKWLETEQQIEQQKNNITTVITIINYDDYQPNETTERQQKDNRRYTNNNDKNNKNILYKYNIGKPSKSYGNSEINYIIRSYKKNLGFTPTDKYPRRVAQNIRQIINTFIKEHEQYKKFKFEEIVDKSFTWYIKRDYTGETLDVFKRKLRIILDKTSSSLKGGDKNVKQVSMEIFKS